VHVRSLKPKLIESIGLLKKAEAPKGKVWIEAYGCSASMADSEMISGLLKSAGYKIASSRKESSLNLIVTCSVKDTTEHKMVHRIRQLGKTGKPLVVAGCLPKADRGKVESLMPAASLMGPHSIDSAAKVVGSALAGDRLVMLDDSSQDKVNLPRVRINPVVSIIEIASGCMSECTFCQTKVAKGWLHSYRVGDIVRQLKADVAEGSKEIWLTSTDSGCYGRDTGSDLAALLRSCSEAEGDFKIRVGMMNPQYMPEMLDRIIGTFESDKLFRFLHMPVQSGSDAVLKKMRRGHTVQVFSDAVKALRDRMPDFTISTDVIVGFPTETEQDFQKTLDLIAEVEPDIVNISRYSARPGTEAAGWKGKRVNTKVVKERSERMHELVRQIARKRNSFWMGWKGEIVIDEVGKTAQGRNYAYKSVVLDSPPEAAKLGSKLRVEVYGFSSFSLKARVIL
jgi:threonylcarbamoyladenosine tRNA methylthiotransferase CDKAL1